LPGQREASRAVGGHRRERSATIGRQAGPAGSGRRLALRDRPFLAFAGLGGVLTCTFNELTSVGVLSCTAAGAR
jgi:hypothetical protein